MATISELIRSEADGTISFGDYTLGAKAKLDNFEHQGDIYKVKTFSEITKLERNGMFVYESVPGTAVMNLNATDTGLTFQVEGPEDAQITVELESSARSASRTTVRFSRGTAAFWTALTASCSLRRSSASRYAISSICCEGIQNE